MEKQTGVLASTSQVKTHRYQRRDLCRVSAVTATLSFLAVYLNAFTIA